MINKNVYSVNNLETPTTSFSQGMHNSIFKNKIIVILLFFLIISALSVIPLNRAINQQLTTLEQTTNHKYLTEELVFIIAKAAEVERAFLIGNSMNEQKLQVLNAEHMAILQNIMKIYANNPQWHNGNKQLKHIILDWGEFLNNLPSNSDNVAQNTLPSLSLTLLHNIRNGNLIKYMLSFIEQEENRIKTNFEKINTLQTALNYVAIIFIILSILLAYFINKILRKNISEKKSYQNSMAAENSMLKQQLHDNNIKFENALKYEQKERQRVEFLLQSASHRIGNSLATASSLLSIQINQAKNDEVKTGLLNARGHIQTLATAHRRLRLNDDMDMVETKNYIETIIKDIVLSLPEQQRENILIEQHIENHQLNARDATTLAIIMGELVINAIKHAFTPDKTGNINIILKKDNDGSLVLIVEDNGKGMPNNINKAKGLGILLITKLCEQFNVKPIFENKNEGGSRAIIKLSA